MSDKNKRLSMLNDENGITQNLISMFALNTRNLRVKFSAR